MVNLFKFKLFLLVFVMFAGNAIAAPKIDSIDTSDPSRIIIKGSSFGTKSPAAPLLWDNFEDGANGANLSTKSRWEAYQAGYGSALFSNAQAYSGSLSAHNRVTGPSVSGGGHEFSTNVFRFSPTDEIYYSYMSKYIVTGDSYGVFKNGRSNVSPNKYNGQGMVRISNGMVHYDPGDGPVIKSDRYISGADSSQWRRQEIYKRNSTPGVANGEVWFSIGNGASVVHWNNEMTRKAGYSFKNDNIVLGLMLANARNNGDHRMFVDDVYVDNTRARVEIGNASTFNSSTQREIQIPYSWSQGQVGVTVNNGNFSKGQKAYVFVIDRDGNPSPGYPITIGSGGSGQTPPPPSASMDDPSNLRIVNQ